MDIYITQHSNEIPKSVEELYFKWAGKKPEWNKYLQFNSNWFVAKDRDKHEDIAVGAIQLIMVADPIWNRRWGLVENVFVDPEYRGKGIAKQIMELVELVSGVMSCEFIKLTSGYDKVEGHALYKSLGYIEGKSFKKLIKDVIG
jgi:GNAT superfamily N-acetyltransferase